MPHIYKIAFLIGCLLPLLFSGCGQSHYPPFEVMGARFFILKLDNDKKWVFSSTTNVPRVEGQRYGWILAVRSNNEIVNYTEEISLAGPTEWHIGGSNGQVSPDGKSATLQRTETLEDGTISGQWTVAKGDPPGKATIKISVDGRALHLFHFELVDTKG